MAAFQKSQSLSSSWIAGLPRFAVPGQSAKLPTEMKKTSSRLSVQVGVLTLSRLFINTGLRMVYPFLPAFARGLGVTPAALAPLIALRGFASLSSPLFGPLSERYGRRPVLLLSILLLSLGCFAVVVWPQYWAFGAALVVITLAKVIYDPAMQAYLGDAVDYGQRGKVLSITELSWAGAFLIGVPVIGFVMQHDGWSVPFFWLAVFGIGALMLLWWVLPGPAEDRRESQATNYRKTIRVLRSRPVIWAAASYLLLVTAANELLLVVYGQWMEDSFSLSITTLGLATAVIGAAELSGEVATAISVDKLGKRRFVLLTGSLATIIYPVLAFTSSSLTLALAALFVLFLFFEMTVVGGVPLLTEIVPSARGIVMSVALAAGGLGRAIGALIGPVIWHEGGMGALGFSSAVLMVLAMMILALWVREGQAAGLSNEGEENEKN